MSSSGCNRRVMMPTHVERPQFGGLPAGCYSCCFLSSHFVLQPAPLRVGRQLFDWHYPMNDPKLHRRRWHLIHLFVGVLSVESRCGDDSPPAIVSTYELNVGVLL